MNETYDVAVVGSGPGGYVAGIKAAQAGLRTVVIEGEQLGGVCLNWGCIPSKALLHSASRYLELQDAAEEGIHFENLRCDMGQVVGRSRRVAEKMRRGVGSLFKKYGVTHVKAWAEMSTAGLLQLSSAQGAASAPPVIAAKQIIWASGALPRALPTISPDGERIITYREAIVMDKLPKRMLILGGGALGVEFAYYLNAFGVEVHLVELAAQLLPLEDAEIAKLLQRSLRKMGIHCYPQTTVARLTRQGKTLHAHLRDAKGGEASQSLKKLVVDQVLLATGMQAQLNGLHTEKLGLALGKGVHQGRCRTAHQRSWSLCHWRLCGTPAARA